MDKNGEMDDRGTSNEGSTRKGLTSPTSTLTGYPAPGTAARPAAMTGVLGMELTPDSLWLN